MLTNIKYILLTALRDRLFLGLLIGVIAAVQISAVLGGTAMVEADRMTLVYAVGAARMILVIGLIVFICFHIRQAFDSKEIDVILSRPLSRAKLVLSYWLGFCAAGVLLVIPTIAIIAIHGVPNLQGFLGWAASLTLEMLLVVALALFSALTLKSGVTSVMASLGLYFLSRMMGFFVATSHSGILFSSHDVNLIARYTMEAISTVIPRLDFYGKSEWLVYGFKNYAQESSLFVVQTAVFVPLLLCAAIADFRRRQF